jgi:uncharacterized protein YkwD
LRESNNVRPLKVNKNLEEIAAKRSKRLAKIQKLKHSPNLWEQMPPSYAIGEIITSARTVKGAYRRLKASPEHKALMLDQVFRQQGAGLTRDRRGILWVVVVFRRPA